LKCWLWLKVMVVLFGLKEMMKWKMNLLLNNLYLF
jgi:hypothetical protein